jgi:hypothetical protein
MNKLLSSRLYNNTDFYLAFKEDLGGALHSVLIESPLITTRRMNKLLPVLRALRQKNVRVGIRSVDQTFEDVLDFSIDVIEQILRDDTEEII